MFLTTKRAGYNRDGEQFHQGLFLILFTPPGDGGNSSELRACVRFAKMTQLGHFMMASVAIAGHRITLSGSYGGDGLPRDCPDVAMWDQLTPVPRELRDAWAKGDGWNSAGSEAPAMRQWASDNLAKLRAPIRRSLASAPK